MPIKQWIQITLLGCVSAGLMSCGTPQNYTKTLSTWNGAPEQALFSQWGHPYEVKHLANGNHINEYRVVEHVSATNNYAANAVPGARMSPQNSTALVMSHVPPVMRNREQLFWCDTAFEVNKMGMIINTHFNGNNCVVSTNGVKRWSY